MPKIAIIPTAFRAAAEQLNLSPGVLSGSHLFVGGVTGSAMDGSMPEDPEAQFRAAFDKIGLVLQTAGLDFDAAVEMTSYHVGLRAHFDVFNTVRTSYLTAPYPAWTAVEVPLLRREGALVEIKLIASNEPG